MKNKNRKIYIKTMIVVVIVYLVIYLFGMTFKNQLLNDYNNYHNNVPKQPINNIFSIEPKKQEEDDNKKNNENEDNDETLVFLYDYDENNYIDLYNQFPTADEVGRNFKGDKYTHDFKLKFSSLAANVNYKITLRKLDDSTLEDDWTKVYLESDGKPINNCFRPNGRIKTFNEYSNYQSNTKEKVIYEGIVSNDEAKRGYKDFTLRMWVSEDVKVYNEDYLQKSFKAYVSVYASKNTE